MKITAPDKANLAGEQSHRYGNTELVFRDGEAEVDELPDGVRAYLLGAGYTVDGSHIDSPDLAPAIDSRDIGTEQLGTTLRDAAVNPEPGDFLPPVGAGTADPHGPEVVAPGIHAEGERIVRPGPVSSDPQVQTEAEQELAQALLIENAPAPSVAGADWSEGNTGPLGLSDPGSAAEGEEKAAEGQAGDGAEPKGNASLVDWQTFARSQGAPQSELEGDEALSRDDLRAKYGS